ncbi:hypothetical protein AX14_013296 [Amanita brunnescens Koide BX004]|nr:hypothetical protein AX14_013296 [Amanita brunnescens Koide BX004]
MRAVTGPLKTGTYIVEAANAPGEFATLNNDKSKLALTKNPESEAVKWWVESLGNDTYRFTLKGSNLSAIHSLEEQNIKVAEGAADWLIVETDVPGEYYVTPVGQPSGYLSMERGEGHIEVKSGAGTAEESRTKYYLVDE